MRPGFGPLVLLSVILTACPPPESGDDAGAGDAAPLDNTAPTIVSVLPAENATDVALDTSIEVRLSEAIDCSTVTSGLFQVLNVSAALSCEGDTLRLIPDAPLQVVTTYTVYFFGSGAVADSAGNTLEEDRSWSFTTGLGDDATPPVPPGADAPAPISPTTARRVLIGGSKEAESSVELRWLVDDVEQHGFDVVASLDALTSWVTWVDVLPGRNTFELRSLDRADRASELTVVTVMREAEASNPVAGGEVKIQFELRDLWDFIGDEFLLWEDGTSNLNHDGVDIWIEGPFASGETCHIDASTSQRQGSRYVATVVHSRDRREDPPYFGFWQYLNYRVPNYLAALIENAQWSYSAHALLADVDRRDPSGLQWPSALDDCNNPLSFTNDLQQCLPRMMQVPEIDGLTEASIVADTTAPEAPGGWSSARSYTWDLRDRFGRTVEPGLYLVQIVVTVDRAQSGPAVDAVQRPADRETCWDDPSDDVRGAHRAEGLLRIDGSTPATLFWDEKGHMETVDACQPSYLAETVVDVCTCAGAAASLWPCTSSNPSPNSRIGERVLYMTPDKFAGPHAVQVEYCPLDACP